MRQAVKCCAVSIFALRLFSQAVPLQQVNRIAISNDTSGGTTVNKLAKLAGAPSKAVKTGTSDTGGAVGIVIAGAGTSGTATIQLFGLVNCVFDGATTADDYVQISSTTAGDCHDSSSTYPTSGQAIGRVLTTNGGAGTYQINLFPSEIKTSSGGGFAGVNAQTISYSLASGDNGKLVTMNGSSLTATLPNAPPSSTWSAIIENLNSTALTISRNSLTINGGTSNITLQQYQTIFVWTDGSNYFSTVPDVAGTNITLTQASNGQTIVAAAQLHVINFGLDGGGAVIPTGDIGFYPSVDFACTIIKAEISADASSSVTVDIWKAAGAIPTSANKISSTNPVTLSSAQLNQSSSLSGWTTSVSSGDVFGFSVATASTATKILGQIWCQ